MANANKTCVSGKKSRGLKICSRSILPVCQINTRQVCVYTKDRKLLSQQKEAVYQHTCINVVKIFVLIFGLLIYLFPRCTIMYLYVGLIT